MVLGVCWGVQAIVFHYESGYAMRAHAFSENVREGNETFRQSETDEMLQLCVDLDQFSEKQCQERAMRAYERKAKGVQEMVRCAKGLEFFKGAHLSGLRKQ